MAQKFSIYAGPPIAAALAATKDNEADGNRSGRLNTVAERYLGIVQDELRRIELTAAEWCCIMDVLNGTWLLGDHMVASIGAEIADAPEMDEKWEVNTATLARKVSGLTWAAKAAIIEAAERFWARSGMETGAALTASGITPKG